MAKQKTVVKRGQNIATTQPLDIRIHSGSLPIDLQNIIKEWVDANYTVQIWATCYNGDMKVYITESDGGVRSRIRQRFIGINQGLDWMGTVVAQMRSSQTPKTQPVKRMTLLGWMSNVTDELLAAWTAKSDRGELKTPLTPEMRDAFKAGAQQAMDHLIATLSLQGAINVRD